MITKKLLMVSENRGPFSPLMLKSRLGCNPKTTFIHFEKLKDLEVF